MIPTWKERLALMDHSKGTTNVMRQEAMKAEIADLRKQITVYRYTTKKQTATIQRWRAATTRYQKMLAKERRKK